MTLPSPFTLPRSQFNEFLFASIGKEGNGMPLSVVSALARLEIDPWQEAARLSVLPEDLAVAALDGLIRRLPAPGWNETETREIAARLIELLPHSGAPARPGAPLSSSERKTGPRVAVWLLVAALAAAALYSAWAKDVERWDDHGAPIDLTNGVPSSAQPWVEAGYLFLPGATEAGLDGMAT
jgi:hypothetical protein